MKEIKEHRIIAFKILRKLCRISKIKSLEIKGNNLYHGIIKRELNDYFSVALKNTKQDKLKKQQTNSKKIWFFWWQGINKAPNLVRRCYSSLKKNASGYEVVLLTRNNIQNYVDLPPYILNKMKKGKISITHYSDIIRFNLLKEFGGLWVDATILWFNQFDDSMFGEVYTAHGSPNISDKNVSKGKWTSYLIGGASNYQLFRFINNFFLLYYKYNDSPIDYFMTDYILNYAYDNFKDFKNYIDNEAIHNNVNIYIGTSIINMSINDVDFKKISRNTNGLKLTYKMPIDNNSNSVYNYLVGNNFSK